jgi:hypothetical protein
VSYTSAEKAEIVGETTSSFCGCEFAVFSKLVAQVRGFLFGVVGGQAGIVQSRGFLVMLVLVVLVRRGGGGGLILWFVSLFL